MENNKMEITISTNEETNKQVATVAFNVPMRIYLSGERSLKEYKDIVLQHMRNDSSTIFELLEYLSIAVENNDLDSTTFCGTTTTLAGIGKGLQEAVEIVEMDYKRKKETSATADSAVAETDVSAESAALETTTDMAKQIADLLNNPNLPPSLVNAIQEGLTDVYNNDLDKEKLSDELTSPEYIARLLSMAKK
jgi:hypothetical protein